MSPSSTATQTTPDCTDARSRMPGTVRRLVEAIEDTHDVTPRAASRLLRECDVTPDDLAPWADFDHPSADSYGRKMIWDGGRFELMAMSWVDGDMAAIHDHGRTQWGAVKLFGAAEHAVFSVRDGYVTTAERRQYAAGDVLPVGHDLVHQMGNLGQDPFLSLHLYGNDTVNGDVTADARLFELDQGVVQRVSGGVFFDLPDDELVSAEPGVRGDMATTLRHKVELLRRLLTKNDTLAAGEPQSTTEVRLIGELFSAQIWDTAADLSAASSAEPLSERERRILAQEMAAAADMKLLLSAAGLVNHPVASDLEDAADLSCPMERAVVHAEVLAEHLGTSLPF